MQKITKPGDRLRVSRAFSSGRVNLSAVLRRLVAFEHAVVAQDMADAKTVIGENSVTAGGLCGAVGLDVAPLPHRLLVPPERKGQEFAAHRQTLETLDRNEPVDRFKFGAKISRKVEIFVA